MIKLLWIQKKKYKFKHDTMFIDEYLSMVRVTKILFQYLFIERGIAYTNMYLASLLIKHFIIKSSSKIFLFLTCYLKEK